MKNPFTMNRKVLAALTLLVPCLGQAQITVVAPPQNIANLSGKTRVHSVTRGAKPFAGLFGKYLSFDFLSPTIEFAIGSGGEVTDGANNKVADKTLPMPVFTGAPTITGCDSQSIVFNYTMDWTVSPTGSESKRIEIDSIDHGVNTSCTGLTSNTIQQTLGDEHDAYNLSYPFSSGDFVSWCLRGALVDGSSNVTATVTSFIRITATYNADDDCSISYSTL